MQEQPNQLPYIPILVEDDLFVYPFMIAPIFVGDSANKKAIEYAEKNNTQICVICSKDGNQNEREFDAIFDCGVVGNIIRKVELPNGKIKILFQGSYKAKIISHEGKNPLLASVAPINLEYKDPKHADVYLKFFKEKIADFNEFLEFASPDILTTINDALEPNRTMDLVLNLLRLNKKTAYSFFTEQVFEDKVDKILLHIDELVQSKKIENEIKDRVKKKTNQKNREYFLNEQLNIVKEELKRLHKITKNKQEDECDGNCGGSCENQEISYEEKLEKLRPFINDEIYKEVKSQIDKFNRLGSANADGAASAEYVEWVFRMPFANVVDENLSLKAIENQLNKDHYSLEKPKERIIEYFATKELRQKRGKDIGGGFILCFVGPPGVGKTSLANSIATALNRELVRIALGGVDDVSELRGHRRTYVASMPGRIIQGLINARQMNPVIVLDEIDKITGRTTHGNPEAALLEILDPEQNDKFRDNYLNFNLNLNKIIFIATANDISTISAPLRDRMEFIFVNSYTDDEKFEIAKKYLIPQELKKHGLEPDEALFSEEAIKSIIEEYTRESGVRNLRRKIAQIARKIARKIISQDAQKIEITNENLKEFLDKKVYDINFADDKNRIGIVNGLAWTSVGGDTLKIEAVRIKGKGELKITGQLGDVMKESAQIAFSLAKVLIDEGQIPVASDQIYKEFDLHIHIPEGATPKDGPSAGITLLTAIASILSQKPVDGRLAMTGELTLSANVLPIGGLKEKLIAAHKAKISRVLIPRKNYERDLDDLPDIVRKNLQIIPVDCATDVLKYALCK